MFGEGYSVCRSFGRRTFETWSPGGFLLTMSAYWKRIPLIQSAYLKEMK